MELQLTHPTYKFENFAENSKIRIASISKVLVNQLIVVENGLQNKNVNLLRDYKILISLVKLLNAEISMLSIYMKTNGNDISFYEYLNFLHRRYFHIGLENNSYIINIMHVNFQYYFCVFEGILKGTDSQTLEQIREFAILTK